MNNNIYFDNYIKYVDKVVDICFPDITDKNYLRHHGYLLLNWFANKYNNCTKQAYETLLYKFFNKNLFFRSVRDIDNFYLNSDRVTLSILAIINCMKGTNILPTVDDLINIYRIRRATALNILKNAQDYFDGININKEAINDEVVNIETIALENLENQEIVTKMLKFIKKDDWRNIIINNYGLYDNICKTDGEIAKFYGVSRQCINEKSNKAIKKLQKNSKKFK